MPDEIMTRKGACHRGAIGFCRQAKLSDITSARRPSRTLTQSLGQASFGKQLAPNQQSFWERLEQTCSATCEPVSLYPRPFYVTPPDGVAQVCGSTAFFMSLRDGSVAVLGSAMTSLSWAGTAVATLARTSQAQGRARGRRVRRPNARLGVAARNRIVADAK